MKCEVKASNYGKQGMIFLNAERVLKVKMCIRMICVELVEY